MVKPPKPPPRVGIFDAACHQATDRRAGRLCWALAAKGPPHGPGLTAAEQEQFAELLADILAEGQERLTSGEWKAWGCWQGSATPTVIPIGLWQRADVWWSDSDIRGLDVMHGTVAWAGGWIDELTVVVSDAKRSTTRATMGPTRQQGEIYDAHCAAIFPELLSREGAIAFARSQKWRGGIGRKLWAAPERAKQAPNRPIGTGKVERAE